MLAGNKSKQTFFASSASQLSMAKITTLSNAVLAACDALDGVADGIVSNVAACRTAFDPDARLACPAGVDLPTCLTPAQLTTVKTMYAPFSLNTTPPITYYIGWPAGGESDPAGWPFWVASNTTGLQDFSTQFIQYFLSLNPATFVPENNLAIITNRANLIDASGTDYSAFRAHNGKLILWHGTTDWAISFNSTALYYGNVVTAAGGQATADQFVEFFPAPGVQHCSGGSGPDFVDLLTPLHNWVANGTPPSQQNLNILKLNLTNLTIINSRPLCKFPKYPRYSSGDPNVATSYTCM
jgi:feruloyl esterase